MSTEIAVKPSDAKIDTLRNMMGTLPARTNSNDWLKPVYVDGISQMSVTPVGPIPSVQAIQGLYQSFFAMAVATWGDANIVGNWGGKWEDASPESRYTVVWHVLHHKTLPTALESAKFTFETQGGPRHFFDQVARVRLGAGYGSIGCRDNSKLPAEFVLYHELYRIIHDPVTPEEEQASVDLTKAFISIKKAYQSVLECGSGSYQIARSVLPMSYHHQFTTTQNLLSLMGTFNRRSCLGEEEHIVAYAYLLRQMMMDEYGMNMIGHVMVPTCHRTGKCHYVGTIAGGGTPGLFSNLFAPKDRHCEAFVPEGLPDYAEFNQSCTDSDTLIKNNVGYTPPGQHVKLPVNFEEAKQHLSDWEIEVFTS